MFEHYGGDLYDGEAVTKIIPGNPVTIVTEKESYKAKSLVVAAGPWTSKVLQPLGLTLPLTVCMIHVLCILGSPNP